MLLTKRWNRYRKEDSPVVQRLEVKESSPVKNSIFIVVCEIQPAEQWCCATSSQETFCGGFFPLCKGLKND